MDWISLETERIENTLYPRLRGSFASPKAWKRFKKRLSPELETLFRDFHALYGWRWDFSLQLLTLLETLAEIANDRPKHLRKASSRSHDWLFEPSTIWASAYVEQLCGDLGRLPEMVEHLHRLGVTHLHIMPPWRTPEGPNDGGYAVSDYRSTRPEIGTIDDLRAAIRHLRSEGIEVALDFVANHTANDHRWARAARKSTSAERDYYLIFDDRDVPDRYLPSLREIFPDRGGDAYTWDETVEGREGGAWVWTTFHPFQWDLDYRNPAVLDAVIGELGFVANLGTSVIRLDATPFLWKQEGTDCENLPEAHTVVALMATAMRIVAPELTMFSGAIDDPDDVVRFVRPEECRLGYNPVLMSSLWEALATRRTALLRHALAHRTALPDGCQWITYLRSHDDVGWGFADEDAVSLGIDPADHRRFLNEFYSGEFPDSFARGARFQDNSRTGDRRISGTLAALAGLERAVEEADAAVMDMAVRRILALHAVMLTAVGIPLFFLGDEVGQLNDRTYLDDPLKAADNRWMHRPPYPHMALEQALDGDGPGAALLAGVIRLIQLRTSEPAFAQTIPEVIDSGADEILAFVRSGDDSQVLVAVNVADRPAAFEGWIGHGWVDAFVPDREVDELHDVVLGAYEFRILRRPVDTDQTATEGRLG